MNQTDTWGYWRYFHCLLSAGLQPEHENWRDEDDVGRNIANDATRAEGDNLVAI